MNRWQLSVIGAVAVMGCAIGSLAQSSQQSSGNDIAVLKKEAASGNAKAQYDLSLDYEYGTDVPVNYARSFQWMHRAAIEGYARAEETLGLDYLEGFGAPRPCQPQNCAEGAMWVRKAASQGLAAAQFFLGTLYDTGLGSPQNYAKAALWYSKAAKQGLADAQVDLAKLYYKGQGVPQDYAKAYFWFDLGASGNLNTVTPEEAEKERDLAASHLTTAELSQVRARTQKWFEAHSDKAPSE